jgi:hypothetical protein
MCIVYVLKKRNKRIGPKSFKKTRVHLFTQSCTYSKNWLLFVTRFALFSCPLKLKLAVDNTVGRVGVLKASIYIHSASRSSCIKSPCLQLGQNPSQILKQELSLEDYCGFCGTILVFETVSLYFIIFCPNVM